jgi:hypothetical protein
VYLHSCSARKLTRPNRHAAAAPDSGLGGIAGQQNDDRDGGVVTI